MWINIHVKNMDAPFACKIRINHPILTSRQIWITLWNAICVFGT